MSDNPTIRVGEPVPIYEGGHVVAEIRLRASSFGAVLEVRQLSSAGIFHPRWTDAVYITCEGGRLIMTNAGRGGRTPTPAVT